MNYTKKYYEGLLYNLLSPFIPLYDSNNSSVNIPNEIEASYELKTLRLEAFSRSLLGWAFLKGYEAIKLILFSMIKNGVNRNSDKYWGGLKDNDQKVVEMFPILLFCVENKTIFENVFDREAKNNLQTWFLQINDIQIPRNNWLFFIILVNRFLQLLDLKHSEEKINKAFTLIDQMYLEGGWYSDGKTKQRDYYIAFSFHYYSLLYAKYTPKDKRFTIIMDRSKKFALTFKKFFSKEGNSLAFGRSLTYKFAQIAFWSIYSNFVNDKSELAYVKGLINRNLHWWFSQNIIDSNGFLNIGYSYSNQFMTEYYNAKGSSYWCLKSFAFLLNRSNLFFNINPAAFCAEDSSEFIYPLCSTLITHNGHSFLFMNGQNSKNEFGNIEAKYEKFLYTTLCAPCVSRSFGGIENLACDNSLVIHIGNSWLIRKHCNVIKMDENIMISEWVISKHISVISYIFPSVPYHYRVHVVKTNQNIKLYDFGTAVKNNMDLKICTKNNIAICSNQNHTSSIYTLSDWGLVGICMCSPNVNIQHPKVVLPYTCSDFSSGIHYVIDCCYNDIVPMNMNHRQPEFIKISKGKIFYQGRAFNLMNAPSPNGSSYSKIVGIMRKIKQITGYFK